MKNRGRLFYTVNQYDTMTYMHVDGKYRCDHCLDGRSEDGHVPAHQFPVTKTVRMLGERCPGCYRWCHGGVYNIHHIKSEAQLRIWQDESMGLEPTLMMKVLIVDPPV